uniref:Tegument protein VP22 n=1 Tax=Equine herpesvirus 4 (strain 1942) TaxID=10333 RepID=VP22_EHV4|nr:RecName: Full=Tegument protein VP22; AltName: Full=Gene 11 protein [Equine herpesvirus type 4 (strain 1942)]CAA35674.1 B4 [Equid alphaherpesvirus 4]
MLTPQRSSYTLQFVTKIGKDDLLAEALLCEKTNFTINSVYLGKMICMTVHAVTMTKFTPDKAERAAHYNPQEHIYETCPGDEFYDACEYSLVGGGKLSTSHGRLSPTKTTPHPKSAGVTPPQRVPARPATRAAAPSATPTQPDCVAKQRTSPGVNSIKSGKSLAFSCTPKTPKTPWYGATHLFNKNVFCAAVSRVAAAHASDAASALWDLDPPKTNEDLDRFLKAAAIRILVCEGSKLLEMANATMERSPDGAAAVAPIGYDRRPRLASRRRSIKCKPPADDFFDDTDSR